MSGLFGGGGSVSTPAAPPPPPPTPRIDEARARREAQDAANRRRGRQASVFTGSEGVGSTPVGTKTLVGS